MNVYQYMLNECILKMHWLKCPACRPVLYSWKIYIFSEQKKKSKLHNTVYTIVFYSLLTYQSIWLSKHWLKVQTQWSHHAHSVSLCHKPACSLKLILFFIFIWSWQIVLQTDKKWCLIKVYHVPHIKNLCICT